MPSSSATSAPRGASGGVLSPAAAAASTVGAISSAPLASTPRRVSGGASPPATVAASVVGAVAAAHGAPRPLEAEEMFAASFPRAPATTRMPFDHLLVPVTIADVGAAMFDTRFGVCVQASVPRFSKGDREALADLSSVDPQWTLLDPRPRMDVSPELVQREASLLFTYWSAKDFTSKLLLTLQMLDAVYRECCAAVDRVEHLERAQGDAKRQRKDSEVSSLQSRVFALEADLQSERDGAALLRKQLEDSETRCKLLRDGAALLRVRVQQLEDERAPLVSAKDLMQYLASNALLFGHRERLEELLSDYSAASRDPHVREHTVISVTANGPVGHHLVYESAAAPGAPADQWFNLPRTGGDRSPPPQTGSTAGGSQASSVPAGVTDTASAAGAPPPARSPSEAVPAQASTPAEASSQYSAPPEGLPAVPLPAAGVDPLNQPSSSSTANPLPAEAAAAASPPKEAEAVDFGGGTPPEASPQASREDEAPPEDSADSESSGEESSASGANEAGSEASGSGGADSSATDTSGGATRDACPFPGVFREVPEREWAETGLLLSLDLRQTPGFPDYQLLNPQRGAVYPRYTAADYIKLLETKPWRWMFSHREQDLFFVSPTNPVVQGVSEQVWDFMYRHQRAFWESFHWLPIPQARGANTLYTQRKNRRSSLVDQFTTLKSDLSAEFGADFDDIQWRLWWEPTFWHPPGHPCVWIPPDQSQLPAARRKSLVELARELDVLEPVRMGYSTDRNYGESLTRGLPETLLKRFRQCQDKLFDDSYECPVPCAASWSVPPVDDNLVDGLLLGPDGQLQEGVGW